MLYECIFISNSAGVGDISERLVALRQTLTELLPGFLGMRASAWRELPPITLEQNQVNTESTQPHGSQRVLFQILIQKVQRLIFFFYGGGGAGRGAKTYYNILISDTAQIFGL